MIDERINSSLSELEANLREVESARMQVKQTVEAYNSLRETTAEFVGRLGVISTKIQQLVDSIRNNYEQKVQDLDNDRENIIIAAQTAINQLSNETTKFEQSRTALNKKLTYCIILNVITLVALGAMSFLLFVLNK